MEEEMTTAPHPVQGRRDRPSSYWTDLYHASEARRTKVLARNADWVHRMRNHPDPYIREAFRLREQRYRRIGYLRSKARKLEMDLTRIGFENQKSPLTALTASYARNVREPHAQPGPEVQVWMDGWMDAARRVQTAQQLCA